MGSRGKKNGQGMAEGQEHGWGWEDTEELWSGRQCVLLQGEKKLPGETIFAESQGCRLEGPRDRVGIGRLMREEAASLFWNVFLGGHSVLCREILGSGEGVGSPFLSEVV